MNYVLNDEMYSTKKDFLKKIIEEKHRKCMFCNNSSSKIYIGNDNLISLDKNSKQLVVTHFKKKNKLLGVMKIKYCPMCGKEL